ncbi:MAG TPA: hypothetical protein VJ853_10730 [Thermoanaerobaculia bacterium]|nr:hypothetical protein [Thermoanaerobaculia bacterium]
MAPPGATSIRPGEPTVAATVITIQTTLQPQNKTLTHTIAIANGRARADNELDHWRLFDLDHDAITYVDDLAKTYYTANAPRSNAPQMIATGARRVIQGVEASQFLIRMGAYQRELWIGAPKSVPPELFGMIDSKFANVRGFPLADHAELPYGKSKLVVDHNVVKIEQKNVPRSLLNVAADYRNITAPAGSRPPASSRPRDRNTPEEELPPSSTGRRSP